MVEAGAQIDRFFVGSIAVALIHQSCVNEGSSVARMTRPAAMDDRKKRMDQVPDSRKLLYLEDLQVGQRFASGVFTIDAAGIKAFATEFDPQPFHLDRTAAEASVFRGLSASGWHTAAVAMRLLVTGGLPLANGIIGLGGELMWPMPVRPGDTLQVESEVLEITPSRSKPNQAIVRIRSTMLNQNRETVYVFTSKVLVFKRAAATSS